VGFVIGVGRGLARERVLATELGTLWSREPPKDRPALRKFIASTNRPETIPVGYALADFPRDGLVVGSRMGHRLSEIML
jgi:hypothetical protein